MRLRSTVGYMNTPTTTDFSGPAARVLTSGRDHLDRYYLFYILFLYAAIAYYFLPWPIVASDTDLWYHLNGGRYIMEHHALPTDSSYISFVTPPRPWVDFYWLFQILVYLLH